MEVFVNGEWLADEPGAADAAGIYNEAAVGFVGKEQLADAKHEQRVKAAADNGEGQRGAGGAAEFGDDFFHILEWEVVTPVTKVTCVT